MKAENTNFRLISWKRKGSHPSQTHFCMSELATLCGFEVPDPRQSDVLVSNFGEPTCRRCIARAKALVIDQGRRSND